MKHRLAQPGAIARRWDAEYRRGRYQDEAAIPFVGEILKTLRADGKAWAGSGLYVGCGNGRNYLALVDAGAKLQGLDVSHEAIRRLRARRPDPALHLRVGDFRAYRHDGAFDYLVALQVFQHGSDGDVVRYFANTAAALAPGGLFFLRVNSTLTQIYHQHALVDRNTFGGFTVRYDKGPKRGLLVHFYSREELLARAEKDFELVQAPREEVMRRRPPQAGCWAQWEAVWRRRG